MPFGMTALLHRTNTFAQSRLVPRRSIAVQGALLNRLVERGYGLAVGFFGGLLVAFFDGLAQAAQSGTQAGRIGPVGGSALRGLTGAFERRKMISHVCFVTFVSTAGYSVSAELLIIGE